GETGITVSAVAASWDTTIYGGGGRNGTPTTASGRRGPLGVVTALPAGRRSYHPRAVLMCERGLHRLRLRQLISQAMPEISSAARATWSRQLAITAGRHGSICQSGAGLTSRPALSQRPDVSGSQRIGSTWAARRGDCWNCRATVSRLARACSA